MRFLRTERNAMFRDFSAVSGNRSRYPLRRIAAGLAAAAALGAPAASLLGAAEASAAVAGRGGVFLEVAPAGASVPPPTPGRDGVVALRCAIAAQAPSGVAFVPPPVSCL